MARTTRTETLLRHFRHPVRAETIAVLRLGTGSASEIAKAINEPTRTVAYHLRKLEEEGVIAVDEVRERRGGAGEKRYRLEADYMVQKDDWDRLSPLDRERIGSSVVLTILGDLSRALSAGITSRADSSQVWDSFPVDEAGTAELQELVTAMTAAAVEIRDCNRDRLQENGEAGQRQSVLIATYATPTR